MKGFHNVQWHAGLVAVVGALVIGLLPTSTIHEPFERDGFDDPDLAAAYEYQRRAPTSSGVDTVALYERAQSQLTQMPRFSTRIDRQLPFAQAPARVWPVNGRVTSLSKNSPLAVLDTWEPLGPGNIGGRTRVIKFHPTRPTTVFAAGVSGGIWRIDGVDGSWRPISEKIANLAVNSLAIDPRNPDVMYAGTGEGYIREEIRGTGLPLRGGGIFSTRDGGSTWQRLESTATGDFHWVNDLELGIGDSRHVYAATRTGVWRSQDEGNSWTRLLATQVRGGCLELTIRPDDRDDTLFASCGTYEQATVYRIKSARSAVHIDVVLQEPNMGRVSLAIAPSQPAVIYAMAASNVPGPNGEYEQGLLAVFRSERGGDPGSWEARVRNTDPIRLNTLLLTNIGAASVRECVSPTSVLSMVNMGWYVNVLAVDPRDPNRVWAGSVDWMRSDDGGRNWGMVTGNGTPTSPHVDQHGIAFHPDYDGQQNQVMLIGNDGGVYRTENARGAVATGPRASCTTNTIGVAWQNLNRSYGVTQFYHGFVYRGGTAYIGGAQDNGTLAGSDSQGAENWRNILGGDGAYAAVQGDLIYAQSQFSNLAKSPNGGTTWQAARNGLDPVRSSVLGPEANFLFVTPLAMDEANNSRLWIGGDFLYRTTNSATNWTKASTAMPDGALVSAIAIHRSDGTRVAAGTTRGHILVSTSALEANATTTWPAARPREGWVTSVAHDPRNAEVLYATYGNFGGPHVYRSEDGGASWTALDGAGEGRIPDIPIHSIVVDPDDSTRLYLGTDVGVLVSLDRGATWMVEETGYGRAVTEWITLSRDAQGRKWLFAFTHGRGVWRVRVL